jgi:hypothetical protein
MNPENEQQTEMLRNHQRILRNIRLATIFTTISVLNVVIVILVMLYRMAKSGW